jgi:hypothetical protein
MKKTLLILTMTFLCASAYAQSEKKENRVRIVTIENGQKKVIEKTFDDEKDLADEIKIIEDTLQTKDGKKRMLTIDVRKSREINKRADREIIEGPKNEMRVFRFKNGEGEDDVFHVLPDAPDAPMPPRGPMELQLRKIHKNVPGFGKKLKEQMSETINGLHIQPNAPFNGKFNIHFKAPEKGTVTIAVTDLNGKELAAEQIKDFQGDYLGQIDIKKSAKGVYFIRVTQGNDGAVRRVKVD